MIGPAMTGAGVGGLPQLAQALAYGFPQIGNFARPKDDENDDQDDDQVIRLKCAHE